MIKTERHGTVLVASTEDRIDGVNAREFQDALQAAISDDDSAVVLDLERLTYISSAGLRVILLVAKTLQRQDKQLAVCSLGGPVREVFEISGFDRIIQTHESQSEAVATLAD
jgi:anti-anti-sigma factor